MIGTPGFSGGFVGGFVGCFSRGERNFEFSGGFVGGFASGTMEQLETLNADKLSKLGQGIKDLGVGILAFAGGQGVGAVTGVMSKIGSLFGSDSPLEQITDLSKKIKDEDELFVC